MSNKKRVLLLFLSLFAFSLSSCALFKDREKKCPAYTFGETDQKPDVKKHL